MKKDVVIDLRRGNCLEVMKTIPDGSVDLVLCDMPYGTTACKWDTVIPFEPMWEQYWRVLKKNRAVVLFGSQPFSSVLIASQKKRFKYQWVWKKSRSGSAFLAKYQPLKIHEDVLVFGNGRTTYNPQKTFGATPYSRIRVAHKRNDHSIGMKKTFQAINDGSRYPLSIIEFKQDWSKKQQVHPAQKPVALMEYLVSTYTHVGETVLDNCMGSGSTGVAAVRLGRDFIGIELDVKYFDIAKQRIDAAFALNSKI